jgi:hypothetical protein
MLSPTPHNPKVVAMLKVPFPLLDIEVEQMGVQQHAGEDRGEGGQEGAGMGGGFRQGFPSFVGVCVRDFSFLNVVFLDGNHVYPGTLSPSSKWCFSYIYDTSPFIALYTTYPPVPPCLPHFFDIPGTPSLLSLSFCVVFI